MQEIAPNVFIETGFPGVTLGVINWSHGLILIDAPFRADDCRVWRSSLSTLSTGVDRLLVNLDAHFDRTLGARAMECTIVGHERAAIVFRDRPLNFKPQVSVTGAEWEQHNGLIGIRWAAPEITFTERLEIQWSKTPLVLEYRPGPSAGSIWANLASEGILFLGDTVLLDQPPFLASADISSWLNTLSLLSCPEYQGYLLVSGRGGLVTTEHVRRQIRYLEIIQNQLKALADRKGSASEIDQLVPTLLAELNPLPAERCDQYAQRLRWGLQHYYARHYYPGSTDLVDE